MSTSNSSNTTVTPENDMSTFNTTKMGENDEGSGSSVTDIPNQTHIDEVDHSNTLIDALSNFN